MRAYRLYFVGFASVACLLCGLSVINRRQGEPRSLDEVLGAARQLGLHVHTDVADGMIQNRLIISVTPLRLEDARDFVIGRGDPARFEGMVALYMTRGWVDAAALSTQPQYAHVWGSYFVYGDPEVMRRLREHGQD
jgi:hypothetical protein